MGAKALRLNEPAIPDCIVAAKSIPFFYYVEVTQGARLKAAS